MAWLILASSTLLALTAFVVREVRGAPEVDDSYEFLLQEHYRAKADEDQTALVRIPPSRDCDAA